MSVMQQPSCDHPIAADPGSVSLSSLRHPLVERLLRHYPEELQRLVAGLGSPLHVMLPQVFTENLRRFQQAFAQSPASGSLLFAKKANKADCLVQACAAQRIGVDVASVGELEKALAGGVAGQHIGVSGPEKSDRLLALCISHQCLLAIDSLAELQRVQQMAQQRQQPVNILLRWQPDSQPYSRFGLQEQECQAAIAYCYAQRQWLKLLGFSFHLGGYSVAERASTANQLLEQCIAARKAGLEHCSKVNLGGGLAVRYVDPQAWKAFCENNRPAHYHAARAFAGFYPYGSPRAGAEALADLLASAVGDGLNLGQKAARQAIELLIEPGRALLDQAGLSAFRVQAVKDRSTSHGYAMVTVEGSSFSLSEQWFNSEYLPEPVLLTASPREPAPFVACIGGSSCLEADMLTWRKIRFEHPVRPGDLLLYLNTAGYQMDSNESPFHEARLPHKVVVELDGHALRWKLDGLA